MGRIRQIKQIAQKIPRRRPEQCRRPRPPGRHCSTGRRGGLGPGAPAAARHRRTARRRRAARSRPRGLLTTSAPTGRRPRPRAGGADGPAVAVLAVAALCALLGGFAAFAATLGGPAPGPAAAPSIAPGDVTGTLAPGGTGTAPGDGGTAPSGTQPGSARPVVDPAERTDRPAGRRAGAGRSRRPVLRRRNRLPGRARGHRAGRRSTTSAPGRPGPSAAGARSRPAAWSRSTSCRLCSPGSHSACRRPTRRALVR